MSVCKIYFKPYLIYIACTIYVSYVFQLVRGFSWSYYHRLSHECPPIETRERPVSAGNHHLLLMGVPEPNTQGYQPFEPTTEGPSPPAVDDEEYDEQDRELMRPREPDEPSPFALFLVDRQFKRFEEKMNEEFQYVLDNLPKETPPVWHIYNYKAYMMKAFRMVKIMYEVQGSMKTGDGICDVLILPKPGDTGSAFIVNYVLSESQKDLRKDAKRCLQTMLDQRFGLELRDRHPSLDDVYKVGISFCGPKAALEYSDAIPAIKFESTTRRRMWA